jgi:hypothetical protein
MSGVDTIYTMVQDDVKRPDKQAQIWRRIHRSILKHHRMDRWFNDLIEQIFNFDVANSSALQGTLPGAQGLFMNYFGAANPTLNVQQIDTSELIRFRKIDYLRKWMTVSPYGTAILDPITGRQGTVEGGDLTERSPSFTQDGYGFDTQDTFYASGGIIQINSSTPLNKVFIGYLTDPLVNLSCATLAQFQTYNSWIADNYPGMIVCDVKTFIFSDIGKNESEIKGARGEYEEEKMAFLANNINLSTKKG